MKEIGGYLELEKFYGKPYHDYLSMNTGRAAILFFLHTVNAKKIFLPYFICDSVKNYLVANKMNLGFYHIDSCFNPIFDQRLNKDEYILIVNTFGQLDEKRIKNLKRKYDNLILDNTHAFFNKAFDDINTVYSCRKFLGVPDGAYLHVENTEINISEAYFNLMEDNSSERFKHLLGRFENDASTYYSNFIDIDASFESLAPMKMSKLTTNFLRAIDYPRIIEKRNKNFKIYDESFNASNIIKPKMLSGPFCYPYYVQNGSEIRKKLIEKKIYIPILWSNVVVKNGASTNEEHMSNNLLPLPVDQRLSKSDINHVIDIINEVSQ